MGVSQKGISGEIWQNASKYTVGIPRVVVSGGKLCLWWVCGRVCVEKEEGEGVGGGGVMVVMALICCWLFPRVWPVLIDSFKAFFKYLPRFLKPFLSIFLDLGPRCFIFLKLVLFSANILTENIHTYPKTRKLLFCSYPVLSSVVFFTLSVPIRSYTLLGILSTPIPLFSYFL